MPFTRRKLLSISAAITLSGCGTVLHPERRGQPEGRLDWKIVALDGLGLIFFFVPGVIAFAVDFASGAIYLPPEETLGLSADPGDQQLVTINTASPQPSLDEVQQTVSRHADQEVKLTPGSYFTEPLGNIRDFWKARTRFLSRT